MQRSSINYKKSLQFTRWSHNAMAAFLSMHEVVQIGKLNISIAQNLAQKDNPEPGDLLNQKPTIEDDQEPDFDMELLVLGMPIQEQSSPSDFRDAITSVAGKGTLLYSSNQPGPFGPFFISL